MQKPKKLFHPQNNGQRSLLGRIDVREHPTTALKFVCFYVFRDVKGKQQICDAGVLFIDFSLVATSLGGRGSEKWKFLEFSLKTGVTFCVPRLQLRFFPDNYRLVHDDMYVSWIQSAISPLSTAFPAFAINIFHSPSDIFISAFLLRRWSRRRERKTKFAHQGWKIPLCGWLVRRQQQEGLCKCLMNIGVYGLWE